MAGCKLQMKAALRIRHAAAGEKGSAQEGCPAAVFLQNGKIDMVGDGCGTVSPEGFKNGGNLRLVRDQEAAPADGILRREDIEGKAKCLPEQLRQPGCKIRVGGGDTDHVRREGMAIEKHPAAFCNSAAAAVELLAADFFFCIEREGHGRTSWGQDTGFRG